MMTAPILLKKSKRAAAAYIQAECEKTSNPINLSELLDLILDVSKPISEFDVIDWCKWLIAGGKTPEEFSTNVLRYDNATTCGLVWTANFVAYRCRTCGISPCMSLCAECFQKGNHEGHDFNMFRSQAGGACDCGDPSVMRESGFCFRHGPQAQANTPPAPPDLLCIAGHVMPRVFLRLLQHLRENSVLEDLDSSLTAVHQADDFLTMIHGFSAMGAAMRGIMTRAITNPQIYKNLCDNSNATEQSYSKYLTAVNGLPSVEAPPEYKNLIGLQEKLVHKTLLEELVFWTVKFEFPQKLVCLLLNMLPDPDYKEAFTQAFVLHYSRVSLMLVGSTDSEMISNRVVHVSVQLFSNKSLAFKMTQDLGLLEIMVVSLEFMVSKILILCTLSDKSSHYVVDCASHVMKDHCYWPLVSDLNNVLSHEPIALKFMEDDALLERWFHFLSMFQGMNVNQRELTHHVEFEPNTYYAAFSSELEASASPMWALISHLKDNKTLEYTLKVLNNCENALRKWCKSLKLFQAIPNDSYLVTFHLPLHRYYSVFMSQAIKKQGASLSQVLPSLDLLSMMMKHLLQVQVAFYEILSGLWVRNGLQIKGQAMTYIQCHFCNSMVDADIYLLQICATQLASNTFLYSILDKFHVLDSLTFLSSTPHFLIVDDMSMVESCLIFLATLMTVHTNIGLTERELTELEMVTLLCMGDKTHSQLMELMPEKCGTGSQNRDFELVLNQVADYKAPNFEASGNMQQGMYVPKDPTWENLYDPIYVLLRAVQRRDFQTSLDRFSAFVRQSGKYKGTSAPWPPFRLPKSVFPSYNDPRKALHCSTFYGLIFTLLYKSVYNSDISEHIMALTVHLLELALLSIPEGSDMDMEIHQSETQDNKIYIDQTFNEWFKSNNLRVNLRQIVDKVCLESPLSGNSVESDGEMEPEYADLEMDVSVPYDGSQATGTNGVPCGLLELPSTSQAKEIIPVLDISPGHSDNSHSAHLPGVSEDGETAHGNFASTSNLVSQELVLSSAKTYTRESSWNKTWDHSESSEEDSSSVLKELPSHCRQVWVNESIISLLLKLHSKLSNKPDSYIPPNERIQASCDSNLRIGDGPFFVAKILDRIWMDDMANRDSIISTRNCIWPRKKEEVNKLEDKDFLDKEERRKKARERQQKLMAEFASKQKQFLEQTMESVDGLPKSNEPQNESDAPLSDTEKEYDCVICGQTTPSTEEKPIGLVVLIQATSVLGHRYQSTDQLVLPTDSNSTVDQESLAALSNKRIAELGQNFDTLYWLLSLNIGWEGGIHIQTCGHHLHLSCHKSYLKSLRSQQRQPPSLAVDRGEYSCPLCRQLANSALPLSPRSNIGTGLVKSRNSDLHVIASEILEFIEEDPPPLPCLSNLMRAMALLMEDMSNSTYRRFRSVSTPYPQSIFLFVCSIARTNLEMEIVNRGGSLCQPFPNWQPKKSCIGPLLPVLAMHTKVLTRPHSQLWRHITGLQCEDGVTSISLYEKGVPILIQDMSALLLQFVLTLPLLIDRAHFTCLVKSLYNVLYFQVLIDLSCQLSEEQRAHWKSVCNQNVINLDGTVTTLSSALGHVIMFFEQSHLYFESNVISRDWNSDDIEQDIQMYCVQFLRIATLLRHYLYVEELPIIEESSMEFWHLANYLELVNFTSEGDKGLNCASCLNWCSSNYLNIVKNWCTDYLVFINKSPLAARSLLMQHRLWHLPRLLQLPNDYDRIFQYYHKKQCKRCNLVPKEPSVCLLCGTLICLREKCCRSESSVCEAVQHSIDCGAGTAMFLSVSSSCIIVIRGKRACLWGSVFLDSFGEEDRDLKRGKPLFLSKERYKLLEQQWLQHSFDHTNKRWVWHKDNL